MMSIKEGVDGRSVDVASSLRSAPRIGLIANCQVDPLRHALSLAVPDLHVIPVNVNLCRDVTAQSSAADLVSTCDVVFSQPLSELFGPLQSRALRSMGIPVLEFPNLYYAGFHPDMSYVGEFGERVQSPTGDYHSIAVVYGYLSGWEVQHTVRFYQETISKLVAMEDYEQACMTTLVERSAPFGFPAEDMLHELAGEVFMYTFNHPTAAPIVFTARWLLAQLELGRNVDWGWVEAVVDNPLSSSVAWPAWKSGADWMPVFRGPRGDVYTLITFVEECYRNYDQATPAQLRPRRRDLRVWPWAKSQ